jgi:uncharacterized protein
VAFLVLHGIEGSGPEHWQTWIARRLREHGAQVAYPDLPEADAPRLERWLAALDDELARLPPEETTVLCHSLGGLLWLHHSSDERERADVARALLVAPPQPDVEVPGSTGFRPVPLGRSAARETRFVCSTNDPWCPADASRRMAEAVGAPIDWLEHAGHVNTDAGYGPWPQLEAWCLGATDRLTPSL